MAGSRQLIVKIVGDDKSLQAAFARSTASTKAFASNVNKSLSSGVSVGRSFDPLLDRVKEGQKQADEFSKRLAALDDAAAGAGVGTGRLTDGLGGMIAKGTLAGLAITSAYTASRRLSAGLEQTGEAAFTASGKLRNFGSALLGGDVVGAFQALNAQAKTLDEAGISAEEATGHYAAFKAVIASGFEGPFTAIAQQAVKLADGLRASQEAADALADSTARLGTVFRTSTGDAVAFKGAVDDLAGPRGPGAVDAINAALEQARGGFGKQISPQASRTAKETIARASGDLQDVLRLQKIDERAAKEALATSNAVGKDREALNQSVAEATAAVITTQRQIKAQHDAVKKTADEAKKADPSAQWRAIIASLQLGVDQATLTRSLNDDLARLEDLKHGLERQVKSGVDVVSAQSALVTVVGQIAAKQEEIRVKAAEAVQARQFRALGLGGTGEDLIPGVENLRKQLGSLTRRLAESGADLPSKLAQQLAGARKVLSGELGKATSESRSKINELFKTIRDTFDQQSKQGPLTRNSVFQANKILEGLGLSPDIERQIRQRVNAFNNAGATVPRFNAPSTSTAAAGGVVVENHNTITLDGDVIARTITRSQQKTRRRNPTQKRGPNRGI